jgi:hypothetical protein
MLTLKRWGVIAGVLAICGLVLVAQEAGVRHENYKRKEVRHVILFDVEDTSKMVDGQKVFFKLASYSQGLEIFQLPIDERSAAEWKAATGPDGRPPQIPTDLFVSQRELDGGPSALAFTAEKLQWGCLYLALGILVYGFASPLWYSVEKKKK